MEDILKNFIVENGEKISRSDVIVGIRNCVKNFFEHFKSQKPIYVNLIMDKIGSEHWIYLIIRDLLPEHIIITTKNQMKIDYNDIDIFFFDDWVLSGCNSCAALENLLYEQKKNDIRYYIMSYIGSKHNENINGLIPLYPSVKIKYLHVKRAYLLSEKLKDMNISYDRKEFDAFHIKYNPDTECESFLIYSDYKIPNQFGSYPSIYKYKIDRTFMDDVRAEIGIVFISIQHTNSNSFPTI